MPGLVTAGDVRAHGLETDLTDEALEHMIQAEEAALIDRFGPHGSAVEDFVGRARTILLRRRAQAITSVTEYDAEHRPVSLAPEDYALVHDGWGLARLATGPHPATFWGRRVKVEYVPVDEIAKRRQIIIQLVKLTANYTGVARVSDPDGSITEHDYTAERNRILRQLSRGPVMV